MFDLQSCIHFHEPEAVFFEFARPIDNKFYCSSADIIHGFGGINSGIGHGFAHAVRHAGGGGFFNHFLMAALQRAIALEHMDDITMCIAKDLYFNMARALDIFFNQDIIITKTAGGLAFTAGERRVEIRIGLNLAHAFPAAACHGFN